MKQNWEWHYQAGTVVTGFGETVAYVQAVRKRSNDELVGVRAANGQEYKKNCGKYGDGQFYPVEEYGRSPDKIMGLQACRRKDEPQHKAGTRNIPHRPRKNKTGNGVGKGLAVIGKDADGNWIIGKWCAGHGEFHPVSEFCENTSESTGYQTYCRKYHNEKYGRNRRRSDKTPTAKVPGRVRELELLNTAREIFAELAKRYRDESY